MKLLAKTEDGWLITANKDEIVHLMGFFYAGQTGCPDLAPGLELKVNDVYNAVYKAARLDDTGFGLVAIATELEIQATALRTICKFVKPVPEAAKPILT